MTNKKLAIEIKNLSFSYNQHPVLENISLNIAEGEYLGIIGPNGGGKTTLVKLILGLLKPPKGKIKIFGKNIEQYKARFDIGFVPQRASQAVFHFPMTVDEIIKSGRTGKIGLFRPFRKHDIEAIDEAMEIADVAQFRKRLVGNLSGGERQRVFIARALASKPKILILDEPAVGIDLTSQERFYLFLDALNKKGMTIMFVSHDIDIVAQEVNSVLCLNHRLVCQGSPKDFIKQEYMEKLYGKKVKFFLHEH